MKLVLFVPFFSLVALAAPMPENVPELLVTAAGDAVVLIMRWNELINTFVLVAACVTAVMFVVGKIVISRQWSVNR